MRFKSHTCLVTAITVLSASTFQFSFPSPASAHRVATPPPVQAAPTADNVRNFGAMGNGIIDDTNAIQNAANDAHNRGIGVFFPPGTYLHANSITFNGVPVTGSGTASQLVSNNQNNCAVILTGSNVSIQNMVISTQGLTGGTVIGQPNTATLAVVNASSWTVANNTIVQGKGIWGLLLFQATIGAVSSNVFDGTGTFNDFGVGFESANNVTIANNILQNEFEGIVGETGLFVAVLSNTIGNVTFPTIGAGVLFFTTSNCDIAQNTIQMATVTPGTLAIEVQQCDNATVAGNNTFGGGVGVEALDPGTGSNFVSQNAIHNCGLEGILVTNLSASAIHVTSNAFGECGLVAACPVILVNGAGADLSGATTFVQNNSYQGHANNLTFYIACTFTLPHIPASNVAGNTQTQTVLSNHI